MNARDLVGSAVANTFRSKTRTLLTILAIFVGAFTLTLTSGLGTGINAYIDDTVSGVGSSNAMTVTKPAEGSATFGSAAPSEPAEYDPDTVSGSIPGSTVVSMTQDDIDAITDTKGVENVHASRAISPDYVQFDDGTRYVASVGSLVPGQTILLSAGAEPDSDAKDLQLALPDSYLKPLGFDEAEDAIGATIDLAITDATFTQHTVEATVVGVTEEALASPLGASLVVNDALTEELYSLQSQGLPADQLDRFTSATVWFADGATPAQIDALKDRLADEGYSGTTVADQLGMITTVIDGIVLVLNAFAIIALLAASFGIVNTLYMSVQERTREIGLMKAMGMGSGRIFTLFSLEAAFLGLLGSAIGVVIAMIGGTAISSVLSTTVLSDLPGLTLIAFDPASIASIILLVMVIAFLAGTLPAARAAKADPVTSLRYE